MSKPSSGHFKNTQGFKNHPAYSISIFEKRVSDLAEKEQFRPHPTKQKQLSTKKLKDLRQKRDNRSISKSEYKALEWNRRLSRRRNEGIDKFWQLEKKKLRANLPGTRNWSKDQIAAILNGERPKYKEQTMISHHTYSVKDYPHLANRGDLIYPATFKEHKDGFHGGNYKQSKPGKQINFISEF